MSGDGGDEWSTAADTGWGHPDAAKAAPARPANRVTITDEGTDTPIVVTNYGPYGGRIKVELSPRRALEVAKSLIDRALRNGVSDD